MGKGASTIYLALACFNPQWPVLKLTVA